MAQSSQYYFSPVVSAIVSYWYCISIKSVSCRYLIVFVSESYRYLTGNFADAQKSASTPSHGSASLFLAVNNFFPDGSKQLFKKKLKLISGICLHCRRQINLIQFVTMDLATTQKRLIGICRVKLTKINAPSRPLQIR